MKYPKQNEHYDCEVFCANFHEIEHTFAEIETNKAENPETASVGQVLRVAATSADGKPTRYVATDLPGPDMSGYATEAFVENFVEESNKAHTHSWNDLEDRPFYNETITQRVCIEWDGDLDKAISKFHYQPSGSANHMYICKMAEYDIPKEKLVECSIVQEVNGTPSVVHGSTFETDGNASQTSYVVIVHEGTYEYLPGVVLDKGIYFIKGMENYEVRAYAQRLTADNHEVTYTRFKQLDEVFIPDNIARIDDIPEVSQASLELAETPGYYGTASLNLRWDGGTSSDEPYAEYTNDYGQKFQFFKMSNRRIKGGATVEKLSCEISYMSADTNIVANGVLQRMGRNTLFLAQSGAFYEKPLVLITHTENEGEENIFGLHFEVGIYFARLVNLSNGNVEGYPTKLTSSGVKIEVINTLNEKVLPDTVARTADVPGFTVTENKKLDITWNGDINDCISYVQVQDSFYCKISNDPIPLSAINEMKAYYKSINANGGFDENEIDTGDYGSHPDRNFFELNQMIWSVHSSLQISETQFLEPGLYFVAQKPDGVTLRYYVSRLTSDTYTLEETYTKKLSEEALPDTVALKSDIPDSPTNHTHSYNDLKDVPTDLAKKSDIPTDYVGNEEFYEHTHLYDDLRGKPFYKLSKTQQLNFTWDGDTSNCFSCTDVETSTYILHYCQITRYVPNADFGDPDGQIVVTSLMNDLKSYEMVDGVETLADVTYGAMVDANGVHGFGRKGYVWIVPKKEGFVISTTDDGTDIRLDRGIYLVARTKKEDGSTSYISKIETTNSYETTYTEMIDDEFIPNNIVRSERVDEVESNLSAFAQSVKTHYAKQSQVTATAEGLTALYEGTAKIGEGALPTDLAKLSDIPGATVSEPLNIEWDGGTLDDVPYATYTHSSGMLVQIFKMSDVVPQVVNINELFAKAKAQLHIYDVGVVENDGLIKDLVGVDIGGWVYDEEPRFFASVFVARSEHTGNSDNTFNLPFDEGIYFTRMVLNNSIKGYATRFYSDSLTIETTKMLDEKALPSSVALKSDVAKIGQTDVVEIESQIIESNTTKYPCELSVEKGVYLVSVFLNTSHDISTEGFVTLAVSHASGTAFIENRELLSSGITRITHSGVVVMEEVGKIRLGFRHTYNGCEITGTMTVTKLA